MAKRVQERRGQRGTAIPITVDIRKGVYDRPAAARNLRGSADRTQLWRPIR
jgi:hypothetical protein